MAFRIMTRLLSFLLLCIVAFTAYAQSEPVLDKEKLFEFYQNQRFSEAATYLQSVYKENSEDPKEISQVAYTNMMAGNLPVAEKNYLKLYQLQPASLPILFNLASLQRRRGNDSQAKFYYKEIIKIDSLNFNVYRQLASLINNPMSSEKQFYLKKANILHPADADVAFELASSFNLSKKNDSAYTVLQTALAADTANMMLLKAKLPVSIALKKLEEAVLTGERLMAYGDSSTYVMNNMGKTYFILKQYAQSLKFFKIIEKMQQQNESTLYYTALCYRELKDYPLAADYMNKSIKESISPYMANYYKILGEVYEKTEQFKMANQSYHKSLDYENKGDVYYNLALLNDGKLKNKKAAAQYYQKFLSSKPDAEKYKEVLDYVKQRISTLSK
ncbi:tetratricopeptide repeat protein [Pedobacter sp. PAMC26386]|nr:tetratricopeptide repeat protein [Pedobacter sp. PAMC26386]